MIEMVPVSQRKCIREDKTVDALEIVNLVVLRLQSFTKFCVNLRCITVVVLKKKRNKESPAQ